MIQFLIGIGKMFFKKNLSFPKIFTFDEFFYFCLFLTTVLTFWRQHFDEVFEKKIVLYFDFWQIFGLLYVSFFALKF